MVPVQFQLNFQFTEVQYCMSLTLYMLCHFFPFCLLVYLHSPISSHSVFPGAALLVKRVPWRLSTSWLQISCRSPLSSTNKRTKMSAICLKQYWSLLNWRNMRFRCGSAAVLVNWYCVVISQCVAIFKNVVHSLEPGETPSNSASHQAQNYVQHS